MAVGYDDKIGTAKFSQVAGKVEAIQDANRIPVMDLIKKEEIESERAKKDIEIKK